MCLDDTERTRGPLCCVSKYQITLTTKSRLYGLIHYNHPFPASGKEKELKRLRPQNKYTPRTYICYFNSHTTEQSCYHRAEEQVYGYPGGKVGRGDEL